MKVKGSLQEYSLNRIGVLHEILKKDPRDYKIENFHQLRVEIKKLRALTDMLDATGKKQDTKKGIRSLKKIFDAAGTIREAQLEANMIVEKRQGSVPKVYLKQLKEREAQGKKLFVKLCRKITLKPKRFRKLLTAAIQQSRKKKLLGYLRENCKVATELLAVISIKTKDLHEVRKILKKIFYNMKSIGINEEILAIKKGDELLQLIGEWHDAVVMRKHLISEMVNKNIRAGETKVITGLVKDLGNKAKSLYSKINKEKEENLFLTYTISG